MSYIDIKAGILDLRGQIIIWYKNGIQCLKEVFL